VLSGHIVYLHVGERPLQYCSRGLVGSALPGSDIPCSAQVVPVCSVNFCWYSEVELSLLDWSAVWTRLYVL